MKDNLISNILGRILLFSRNFHQNPRKFFFLKEHVLFFEWVKCLRLFKLFNKYHSILIIRETCTWDRSLFQNVLIKVRQFEKAENAEISFLSSWWNFWFMKVVSSGFLQVFWFNKHYFSQSRNFTSFSVFSAFSTWPRKVPIKSDC